MTLERARILHALDQPWSLSPADATRLQKELACRVVAEDQLGDIRTIAGIDVGYEKGDSIARGAVVVLDAQALGVVDHEIARAPVTFPYIPGYLSFRELPVILKAMSQLRTLPDLILCDGQGLAHPRRFGIACHLGVLLDCPTIGVGKTRLCGTYIEPGPNRGDYTDLVDKNELVGATLRTRLGVKPVFVSLGHRISLKTAIEKVLACTTRYKLPETTRQAHHLASQKLI